MKRCDLLIGSHVSFGGKEMLLQASKEAASYGASTFLMYTGAPQNSKRKPISQYNIEAGHMHMKQQCISNIVVHAPFLINLANSGFRLWIISCTIPSSCHFRNCSRRRRLAK